MVLTTTVAVVVLTEEQMMTGIGNVLDMTMEKAIVDCNSGSGISDSS